MEAFIRTSNRFKEIAYVRDGNVEHTQDAMELAVLMALRTGKRDQHEVESFVEHKYGWGKGGQDGSS